MGRERERRVREGRNGMDGEGPVKSVKPRARKELVCPKMFSISVVVELLIDIIHHNLPYVKDLQI